MALWAALLRGMNVGGHRITNAELTEEFEGLGFRSVRSYRASGNVIFEVSSRSEGRLVAEIETQLEESLGYAVPTFLRSAAELRAIADFDPFELEVLAASAGKLQVSLLGTEPSEAARERALSMATEDDRLVIAGRELYWLPSGGLLDSELDLDALGELLGTSTLRTKGTIEGMASKLDAG